MDEPNPEDIILEEPDLFTVDEFFEYKNKIKYNSLERTVLEMETNELFRQIQRFTEWLRELIENER